MALLAVRELKKLFVERLLFEGVSFEIGEKDAVGLVGVNGCGKTTLLRMLTGEESADDGGSIYKSRGLTITAMAQTMSDTSCSAYEAVLRVFEPLAAMEREMETLRARMDTAGGSALDSAIARHSALMDKYEAGGGLTYKSRARAALLGLGFTDGELSKAIGDMSGGERNKVQLASVLLSGAGLLLLDEPTNHLDLDSIMWLEDFLKSYQGAFIVISHDRYFLDAVTRRTMEIKNTRFFLSEGNYSRHRELMADEQEMLRRTYVNTQKEIRRIEGIVEQQRRWGQEHNFITAASKQKQADRLRATLVAPEKDTAAIRFSFHADRVSGNDVLIAKGLSKSYGRPVFKDVSLHLRKGERAFLLGPNGCGKTTLLRVLTRLERADGGSFYPGANVRMGYYEQHMDSLAPDNDAVSEIRDAYPHMDDTEIRRALGAFLFRGDDVFKKISLLSGGEKARIQLLKLMLSGANLLLLDEPTNHLDIDSREALEAALEGYDGTMLIVTHDRYLVERLADRVLSMEPGGIREYIGGYEDYLAQRDLPDEGAAQEVRRSAAALDYRAQKERQSAINRAAGEVRRAEERIAKAEAELAAAGERLASPEVASDYTKAGPLSAAMEEMRSRLDRLYEKWGEAQKALEELGGE